jgi:hypothetical protein
MVKFDKVELLGRQLSDLNLTNLRFNEAIPSSLIGCGVDNIRFFKLKNNFLPSQLVTLNNTTSRGRVFNNCSVSYHLD